MQHLGQLASRGLLCAAAVLALAPCSRAFKHFGTHTNRQLQHSALIMYGEEWVARLPWQVILVCPCRAPGTHQAMGLLELQGMPLEGTEVYLELRSRSEGCVGRAA